MIEIDTTADPTASQPGSGVTTLKEAAESVEKAYNNSIDTLDSLLERSLELKKDLYCNKDEALVTMEKHIEHMKSILEAENLRFYCMTKALRSSDKVEKLRAWRDMLQQDNDLAVLKGECSLAEQLSMTKEMLIEGVIHRYGLGCLWQQLEHREWHEREVERQEIQSVRYYR